jgi:hypothetical protein
MPRAGKKTPASAAPVAKEAKPKKVVAKKSDKKNAAKYAGRSPGFAALSLTPHAFPPPGVVTTTPTLLSSTRYVR